MSLMKQLVLNFDSLTLFIVVIVVTFDNILHLILCHFSKHYISHGEQDTNL